MDERSLNYEASPPYVSIELNVRRTMINLRVGRISERSGRRSVRLCSLLFSILAILALPARSQAPAPTELQVKAAYLYKFGAFVQWPNAAASNAFSICILGRDPFGPVLDSTLSGEALGDKKFTATRVSTTQEAAHCQILYVGITEESRLRSILPALSKLPILTVSDIPHFVDRGGMIQFVLENGRVRFDVNLASTEKAGLTLSSQLLKVASAVKRTEAQD